MSDNKLARRIATVLMLLALAITAPHWFDKQAQSAYSAPWIYPSEQPPQH